MKFTKEQVLGKTKERLGKTQKISDRTILDAATNAMAFLPDDSDMEIDAFMEKFMPTITSVNTNFNNDQGAFISKWKEEHPEPKPNPAPKPNDTEEMPAWYKAELERRKAWEEEQEAKLKGLAGQRRKEELIQQAREAFFKPADKKKTPIDTYKGVAEIALEDAFETIKEDDTVEAIVSRAYSRYERTLTAQGLPATAGYVPGDPTPTPAPKTERRTRPPKRFCATLVSKPKARVTGTSNDTIN